LLQGPFNNDPALPVNLITLCKATGDAWGDNTLAELVNKTDNSFFYAPQDPRTWDSKCVKFVSVVKCHRGCA